MKIAHRATLLALVLTMPLALIGCWGSIPMEEVGLVTLMGVDQAPGGRVTATLSVDMPAASSASPGLGQTATALQRHASGRTIGAALAQLRTGTFLKLEFTHLDAIFVSEPAAKAGIAKALSYFAESPRAVTTPYILVVRQGTAQQLLEQIQSAKPRPEIVVTNTIDQVRKDTPYYPERVY